MHQHLVGGRAANAAFYPPELITKILRGMRDTAGAGHVEVDHDVDMGIATTSAGALHDIPPQSLCAAYRESELNHANVQRTVKCKFLNG